MCASIYDLLCVLNSYCTLKSFSMLLNTETFQCDDDDYYYNFCFFLFLAGGELTCNELSCYVRNDCKPKFVDGVCCPEYDNCPPLGKIRVTHCLIIPFINLLLSVDVVKDCCHFSRQSLIQHNLKLIKHFDAFCLFNFSLSVLCFIIFMFFSFGQMIANWE